MNADAKKHPHSFCPIGLWAYIAARPFVVCVFAKNMYTIGQQGSMNTYILPGMLALPFLLSTGNAVLAAELAPVSHSQTSLHRMQQTSRNPQTEVKIEFKRHGAESSAAAALGRKTPLFTVRMKEGLNAQSQYRYVFQIEKLLPEPITADAVKSSGELWQDINADGGNMKFALVRRLSEARPVYELKGIISYAGGNSMKAHFAIKDAGGVFQIMRVEGAELQPFPMKYEGRHNKTLTGNVNLDKVSREELSLLSAALLVLISSSQQLK